MHSRRSLTVVALTTAVLIPLAGYAQEAAPPPPPPPSSPPAASTDAPGTKTQGGLQPGAKIISFNGQTDLNTRPVRQPMPTIADAEVSRIVAMISGSWTTVAAGDVAALRMNMARVDIRGLDNAVYFEIARADTPHLPFRQGLFVFWKKEGYLRLRVLDLGSKALADSVVGLWTSPALFPELAVDQLIPNIDLQLKAQADGWVSEPSGRVPTTKLGAWELESSVAFSPKAVSFNDRGIDMSGKQAFATADGKPVVFTRCEPTITARECEGGMVIIDLVPPKADLPGAEDNTLMAIHYSGWLTDGTCFGTSRGKEAQQIQIPANFIAGFNTGLPGITKGTVRRLWIPSGLAFGKPGNATFKIPPDAPVIFEIECIFLERMPPPTPPEPAPAAGAAQPQPAPAGQPPNQ